MNPFKTNPTPSIETFAITITPVSNGWLVKIPNPNSIKDQFTELMKMVVKSVLGMNTELDSDEVEKMVKASLKISDEADAKYTRDEQVHVFADFAQVLAFLADQIKE